MHSITEGEKEEEHEEKENSMHMLKMLETIGMLRKKLDQQDEVIKKKSSETEKMDVDTPSNSIGDTRDSASTTVLYSGGGAGDVSFFPSLKYKIPDCRHSIFTKNETIFQRLTHSYLENSAAFLFCLVTFLCRDYIMFYS